MIAEAIDVWAVETGAVYSAHHSAADSWETATMAERLPPWAKLLLEFDVDYRKRRLHFLIEGLNRLYQLADRMPFTDHHWKAIDQLKRHLYNCLEDLNRRTDIAIFKPATRDLVEDLFRSAPAGADPEKLKAYALHFVRQHGKAVDDLIERLSEEIDLNSRTGDIDALLAGCDARQWLPEMRHEVLVDYLGFPFWDVLTFPMMPWRETGELHEILVDRISPQILRLCRNSAAAPLSEASASGISPHSFREAIARTTICLGAYTRWID